MHDICRKYKVHFALNMKIKSAIIYLLTDSDVRSLNTTVIEGAPASSSTPLRTSVCYPSIRLLADMILVHIERESVQQ